MIERGTRELDRADEPGSVVPCPLRAHQPIAMGRCVEYQRDNGCHCEHALIALRRTEKFLQEPHSQRSVYDATAITDQLDGVRALISRAEQIEKARPPAPVPERAARWNEFKAKKDEERAVAAEEEPEEQPPPVCRVPGCRTALRVNNLTGMCQMHRQLVSSRQRDKLVPKLARAAGTARNALEATPAPPAKESSMGLKGPKSPLDAVSDTELRKAFEELGSVEKVRKKFASSHATVARRLDALGVSRGTASKDVPAPAPKLPRRVNGKRRPRSLDDVAAKHAPPSAPPADIVGLLQRQLDHHQEQADKCKRALAALQ